MSFIQGYARKLGVLEYRGTWDASTNTPNLQSGNGTRGEYYIVSVAGATNLDGIADWHVNDWAVFNGTTWEKVDGASYYSKEEADSLYTQAKDRSNHTGTQLANTISDFTEAAQLAIGNMLDSGSDIDLVFPDENGKVQASLKTTGVAAGFYNSIQVDSKGRVISGTNVTIPALYNYSYKTTDTSSTTLTTYINVPGLTSDSLPVGLYMFKFIGLAQSTSTSNGIGVKLSANTATISTIYGKYLITQSIPGTTADYQYDQVSSNTNISSTSTASTSYPFVIMGEGIVRITSPGTLSIQFKANVSSSAVAINADANLFLELI